jgi:hypothetical protein
VVGGSTQWTIASPSHPPPPRQFTDTALGLGVVLLNSAVDLVSFSNILYSIYPPLFAAMLFYSIGGTVGSVYVGKVGGASAARAGFVREGVRRGRAMGRWVGARAPGTGAGGSGTGCE